MLQFVAYIGLACQYMAARSATSRQCVCNVRHGNMSCDGVCYQYVAACAEKGVPVIRPARAAANRLLVKSTVKDRR